MSRIRLRDDVIYDDQYIKTKVRTFKMVKTLFDNGKIPEEKEEHECISYISLDSVLKIEQCKYKIKEKKIKSLVGYDLMDSDYESD